MNKCSRSEAATLLLLLVPLLGVMRKPRFSHRNKRDTATSNIHRWAITGEWFHRARREFRGEMAPVKLDLEHCWRGYSTCLRMVFWVCCGLA